MNIINISRVNIHIHYTHVLTNKKCEQRRDALKRCLSRQLKMVLKHSPKVSKYSSKHETIMKIYVQTSRKAFLLTAKQATIANVTSAS